MDAFLLSAGLGTRLRPLTATTPKPLIEIGGRSLIDRNLSCLRQVGCTRVFINVSYLAQQIVDYVADGSRWGIEVIFSYEKELLDTGGGLRRIINDIHTDTFILWNADVFIDPLFCISTDGFYALQTVANSEDQPLVSILVRKISDQWSEYGKLLANEKNELASFLGVDYSPNSKVLDKIMYCGISIMRKDIFDYFPKDTEKFSITRDVFPRILADTTIRDARRILVSYCNYYWNDVGTPKSLEEASYYLK